MSTEDHATLLTIEDNLLVRKAISSYMKSHGFNVLEAADGAEGLEIYHRTHPDLILTDLRIPKVDGMEVLSNIRSENPDTPVIIVSGMGTMDDALKCLRLGAVDYVTKPISDMELVLHAVEKALERACLVRENKKYQAYLEDEIQRRTAELHQAQKLEAIGTLAGGIAHDFNNILGAIMGFTELALIKTGEDGQLHEDLLQIKKASLRAKDLVLQILTFSRKSITEHHPVQVALIIKEALKLLRATLPATVQLTQNIQANDEMIMADPTEIHQVITNLCTNAFHALPSEQGQIDIELSVRTSLAGEADDYLMLRVADNGFGMTREIKNKIFNPFFTTKEKGMGTGLGLSVVHGIVTESDGTVEVESSPGKGSVFTLLFPIVKAAQRTKESVISNMPVGDESILLVDDEEPLRVLGKRMLSYLGYTVTCCRSGPEALERLKDSKTDTLITDQSMPGMPGTELIRQAQKIQPGLPTLLCTGFSSIIDEEKAAASGIKNFLLKPLAITTLAQAVRQALDH
ncbi:MAG: response regulator [Thermodesulfobacteriota bacterium]